LVVARRRRVGREILSIKRAVCENQASHVIQYDRRPRAIRVSLLDGAVMTRPWMIAAEFDSIVTDASRQIDVVTIMAINGIDLLISLYQSTEVTGKHDEISPRSVVRAIRIQVATAERGRNFVQSKD